MLPFTTEDFFAVFARWNEAIWPAQIVAWALGIAVVWAAASGGRRGTQAALAGLALMWAVNGAGYHLWQFARINPAAWGFGALFLVEAALLAAVAARSGVRFGPGIRLGLARRPRDGVALALIVYAMAVYPLLGPLLGHGWPGAPAFGVAPCPTTIFTLGVLMLARERIPLALVVLPLVWAAIGSTAAVLLGVWEDLGLLAAGLATLLLLWRDRRTSR